jgi:hypothetical protein
MANNSLNHFQFVQCKTIIKTMKTSQNYNQKNIKVFKIDI